MRGQRASHSLAHTRNPKYQLQEPECKAQFVGCPEDRENMLSENFEAGDATTHKAH